MSLWVFFIVTVAICALQTWNCDLFFSGKRTTYRLLYPFLTFLTPLFSASLGAECDFSKLFWNQKVNEMFESCFCKGYWKCIQQWCCSHWFFFLLSPLRIIKLACNALHLSETSLYCCCPVPVSPSLRPCFIPSISAHHNFPLPSLGQSVISPLHRMWAATQGVVADYVMLALWRSDCLLLFFNVVFFCSRRVFSLKFDVVSEMSSSWEVLIPVCNVTLSLKMTSFWPF